MHLRPDYSYLFYAATVIIALPLTAPLDAVIVVVAGAIAVNTPVLALIVPAPVLLLLHVIDALMGLPN